MNDALLEARLLRMSVLDPAGDCWVWLGKRTRPHSDGSRRGANYGRINVRIEGRHRTLAAHRVAFTVWRGPIPDGHEVDHTCRNPFCINPAHLDVCTGKENLGRRVFGRRN